MGIQDRIKNLVEEFEKISDWEDRYKLIIQKGKEMPDMDEEQRIDKNLVKGCQSRVWFHAEFKDGKIQLQGDSDASIVKGVVALLLGVYHDSTPTEVLATKPVFLEDIGLRQHLSMSRSNGLTSMLKQISLYALVFQAQSGANPQS